MKKVLIKFSKWIFILLIAIGMPLGFIITAAINKKHLSKKELDPKTKQHIIKEFLISSLVWALIN